MNSQFKYLKFIFLSLLVLLISQCSETTTMHTNDIALKLVKLEEKGVINQSEQKDAFLTFFEDVLIKHK